MNTQPCYTSRETIIDFLNKESKATIYLHVPYLAKRLGLEETALRFARSLAITPEAKSSLCECLTALDPKGFIWNLDPDDVDLWSGIDPNLVDEIAKDLALISLTQPNNKE